jgi:prefoldin subunit 5
MIQYIRLNNLVPGLVATSKGYFVAQSPDEINDWIESLKSRENAIRKIREQAEQHVQRLNGRHVQQSMF